MPAAPDHSLYRLGKYVSLAMLLPASVAGGYFLGAALGEWLHVPILKVLGILLGVAAGLIKIVQVLSREGKMDGPRA
ncbi:MAG: AtpZ/AtpI family protein [Bryobacteraceae bacterium]